jgi:DNA topoisomerase-1
MGWINVNKKYDFDNLSQSDIETLIEDKLQKNIDTKCCITGQRKEFSRKSALGTFRYSKAKLK